MNSKITAVGALALCFAVQASLAEVAPEEAAKLKTTLTPFGAEKAGNKDGSIPAWTGGYTTVAPGYKPGTPRPDPFAAEKPKFSISQKNVAEYSDKLSDGIKAMLQKYPDFRLDVYPTHRTAAAPDWVYDATFKNATHAKTTNGGYGLEGAYGGIPFPLAKTGYEAIWNHRLRWGGQTVTYPQRAWVVTADGKLSLATDGRTTETMPYSYRDGSLEKMGDGYYRYGKLITTAPASKAGESILAHDNFDDSKRNVWQYLVGQRRVRRSPTVSYDTPNFVTSGIGFFDEAFMLFGPIDHHSLNLVGKQEMYIPYNDNSAALAKADDLLKPKFLNPDLVRWELHRVWVVEADLIPGKRHVVPKRRYYIDEDTWQIVLEDGWDAQNQLWRVGFALPLLCPDIPAVTVTVNWGTYNMQTGAYLLTGLAGGIPDQYKEVPNPPLSDFSPDELAAESAR